jgi:signal transduction histidine kinase
VELVTHFEAGDVCLRAAEGQIEQILINLGRNAVQAMPKGGRLTITTKRLVEGQLRLTVSDTGDGMDEATQLRIFEPFFSTRRRAGGTGLGLAAVYAIVAQLGGTIDVVSELGSGATFTVVVPLGTAAEDAEPAAILES